MNEDNNGSYRAQLMDEQAIRSLRYDLEKSKESIDVHGHLREFEPKPEIHPVHRPESARLHRLPKVPSRPRPSTVDNGFSNKQRRSFAIVLNEEKACYHEMEEQYLSLKDTLLRHFDDLLHNPRSIDRELSNEAFNQLTAMDLLLHIKSSNKTRPR
ncbi:hypothetical protein THRCLA_23241 [Thraustotheca clavata]|uniref:Uncharacterized protein n=1 Tax=Thraustotheca clavata TaxID=74557 RepID=A0A1V9Y8S8_9STRA|nr:hypothetical protein THRCLA_23241 [Thraustotheca clavata]